MDPYSIGCIITVCYLVLYGLRTLLTLKLERFTGKKETIWDEVICPTIEHSGHMFMISVALYVGFQFSSYYRKWHQQGDKFFFVILMMQIFLWCCIFFDRWINISINRKIKKNPAAASSISLLKLFARLLIFSIIFLFTLNNLGIKITTILTGLGVGGLAVALGVQKILGDLFSSLSIVMDKPFVVGDFIMMDQYMGEVEKIGLKTTRLRSLSVEQIIISNSDLLSSRIRNYKRMQERRVVILLTLVHGLSPEELKIATDLIITIISNKRLARLERCHFMDITPSSLNIETVYFCLTDDYITHMDLKQEILTEIYASFEQAALRFAYPTQTLHLVGQSYYQENSPSDERSFSRN